MNHLKQTTSVYKEAKDMLSLALPIIIALVSNIALGFFDIIMLGRYDELHFAAGSMGAHLVMFNHLAALGLLMGLSPLIAHAVGAQSMAKVREYFQQGLWIAIAVALLLGFCTYHSAIILTWLDIEQDLRDLTAVYLNIASIGFMFMVFYLLPKYVSEAIELSMPMMVVQILIIPINIFGNYLFIFGNWGFAEMGVKGSAIATVIAQACGTLMMWLYLVKAKYYQSFSLFSHFSPPNIKIIWEILALSIPISFSLIFEAGLFTATLLLMGKYGATAVAAHEVAINYASMMFMVPLGISMAVTVKVGNALGRGELDYAKLRAKIGIIMATGFMVLSACVLFVYHREIAMIYTHYENIVALAAQLLILAGVFQIVDGIQVSVAGALRGFKDTKQPMIMTFISYWIIGMPAGFVLSFYLGFKERGLWMGLIIGLACASVLLSIRLYHFWRKPSALSAQIDKDISPIITE